MRYHDVRTAGFEMTPSEKRELYENRYNSEAAIRLGFPINGYDAFILLNGELVSLVSSIYQMDKKLSLLISRIPPDAMDQFVTNSLIDEIQQSNEVENVNSTRKEIKDAYTTLASGSRNKRFEGMVRKYALLRINEDIPLATCSDIRNLYNDFILDEVVRENPDDAPDGVIFRKNPVHVSGSHGEDIHDGLFPETAIVKAMDAALTVLNSETMDDTIRAALFHYFFGYIHPFYNGNGRMSRFISSYVLSRQFSNAACLRTSYVIKQHRSRYYELFRHANDKRNMGELTEFVIGYLLFFREAVEDTYQILNEKYLLYQKYEKTLKAWLNKRIPGLTTGQVSCFVYLLQLELFGESDADIQKVASLMECGRVTARKILSEANDIVYFSKDGRKQIWHVRLDVENTEDVGFVDSMLYV